MKGTINLIVDIKGDLSKYNQVITPAKSRAAGDKARTFMTTLTGSLSWEQFTDQHFTDVEFSDLEHSTIWQTIRTALDAYQNQTGSLQFSKDSMGNTEGTISCMQYVLVRGVWVLEVNYTLESPNPGRSPLEIHQAADVTAFGTGVQVEYRVIVAIPMVVETRAASQAPAKAGVLLKD